MFKKIIYFMFVILIIFLSSCSKEEIKYSKNYNTYKVATWILDTNNEFVWYTKWKTQVIISSKLNWRINFLEKNIWDKVIIWEKLIDLDSRENNIWYNTSTKILEELNALKKSTITTFDDEIKAHEFKISQALENINWNKNSVINTKNISEKQLDSQKSNILVLEKELEKSKSNLEKNINTFSLQKDSIIELSKSSIKNSIILYNDIINYTDQILWITKINKDKNDLFQDYLSAKDIKYLDLAKNDFIKASSVFDEYKENYYKQIASSEFWTLHYTQIINILKKAKDSWKQIKILLDNTWLVMENSVPSAWVFSDSIISWYKNNINIYSNKLEESLLFVSGESLLWIEWSLQNLEKFETNKDQKLNLLKQDINLINAKLIKANSILSQIESENVWRIDNIKTKNNISQQVLNELYSKLEVLKNTKQIKIKEINNRIFEIQWNKQNSSLQINNKTTFSPINWFVIDKYVEKWQIVWVWTPVYKISDTSEIKINFSLSDLIVNNLKLNDEIFIEIQSLDSKIKWIINNIPNSKDPITKKTLIEIIVNNKDNLIKLWSIAKASFSNNKTDLIIPNNAIISDFLIPSVYVLDWKTVKLKKINIISQSNDFSSISWLKSWDIIITDWKENIYDWEILKEPLQN